MPKKKGAKEKKRPAPPRHVVVVGGGVLGASIAYWTTKLQEEADRKEVPGQRVHITVIESAGEVAVNSGSADGWLSASCCDGTPLQSLARTGFALHAELAQQLGEESCGYRTLQSVRHVGCIGGTFEEERAIHEPVHDVDTSAQVHPGKLTRALLNALLPPPISDKATQTGSQAASTKRPGEGQEQEEDEEGRLSLLLHTTVCQVRTAQKDGQTVITGLQVEQTVPVEPEPEPEPMPASGNARASMRTSTRWLEFSNNSGELQSFDLVLAMGVWSGMANDWGLGLNMELVPVRGQSLLLQAPADALLYCVEGAARDVVVPADGQDGAGLPNRLAAQILPLLVCSHPSQIPCMHVPPARAFVCR